MATITIIDERGNEREVSVSESTFGVVIDGDVLYPAATQSVEVESNGNQETTGTQCGDVRQQTTSTDPFSVTVECIITLGDGVVSDVDSVFTVRDALHNVQQGDVVRIRSAFPIEEQMTVSNVLVRQETELVSVNTSVTSGSVTAFRCQLQFGAEESSE